MRVIAYAVVDESVEWTGRQRLFVGDELLGEVPRLALGQNIRGPMHDFLLLHCDEAWTVLGVTGAATIESIKAQAESAYGGITERWVHVDVTPEAADAWLRATHPRSVCAFCARLMFAVEQMIEGDGASIFNDCVNQFHQRTRDSGA